MIYKDLPFNLNDEPVTDKAAVKQAIWNILNTTKGEMPGKPEFGCPLDKFLFEPMDSILKSLMIGDINAALNDYEPRIQIDDVSVEFQEAYNRVDISVQFQYTGVKTTDYDVVTFSVSS